MSILNYFSSAVPNPRGLLSHRVPPSAIKSANKEVQLLSQPPASSSAKQRRKYYNYTPKQRAEIGKHASSYGTQSARRKYSKILGEEINESTVRQFKKVYQEEIRQSGATSVTELHLK